MSMALFLLDLPGSSGIMQVSTMFFLVSTMLICGKKMDLDFNWFSLSWNLFWRVWDGTRDCSMLHPWESLFLPASLFCWNSIRNYGCSEVNLLYLIFYSHGRAEVLLEHKEWLKLHAIKPELIEDRPWAWPILTARGLAFTAFSIPLPSQRKRTTQKNF